MSNRDLTLIIGSILAGMVLCSTVSAYSCAKAVELQAEGAAEGLASWIKSKGG